MCKSFIYKNITILTFIVIFWSTIILPVFCAEQIQESLFPVPRQPILDSKRPITFYHILHERGLNADISYILMDLETNEIIEAINPSELYPLASVSKIITALYGLEILGPSFNFETKILIDGSINNGVLDGNLMLLGGGDPSLTNDHLMSLIDGLYDAGLREVDGKFIVSAGETVYHPFIDSGQPEYLSYNPSISGLNINFNRVLFDWDYINNQYIFKLEAKAEIKSTKISNITIDVLQPNETIPNAYINGKDDKWQFSTTFLGKASQRWLPVRQPQRHAAEIFWKFANERGIDLPQPSFQNKLLNGKVLRKITGVSLDKNVGLMLKYSNNLLAEAIGLKATQALTGEYKSIKESANVMQNWLKEKIGKSKTELVDHSGLGSKSKISAYELIKLLEITGWDGNIFGLMNDHQFRKRNSAILKNYTNVVKVKTGSLNFVSNIVGFIETNSGNRMAFVILTSNMNERNKLKKEDRDNPLKAKTWVKKSRQIQLDLIEYWSFKYN